LRRKKAEGEYLAFLTVKYDVHPDMLFCALLAAGEMGKAKCGELEVECRGEIDDKIYFLIREGDQVVSQFPVAVDFLEKQKNPIRNFMETDLVQSFRPEQPSGKFYSQIEDLKVGATHVNLKAEVLKVTEPTLVNTQYGNRIRMAKALLKDSTGEINLCLWRDQVETVSKGDHIELENASVTKFRGTKQLTTGNKGILKVVDPETPNNPVLEEP
jgi:replication factor A1